LSALTLVQRVRSLFRRYAKTVLTSGLFVGTLTAMVLLIVQNWESLRGFQWHLMPGFLVLAFFCHAGSLFGTFVVWRSIMVQLGSPVDTGVDFRIFFISLGARKVPSAIWYAGTRLVLYAHEGVKPSLVLSALSLELVIAILTGVWTFVLFQPYYIFLGNYSGAIDRGVLVTVSLLSIPILVFPQLPAELIQRIRRRWHKDSSIFTFTLNHTSVLIWSLVYLLAWIIGGTSFYCTIRALIPDSGIDWINSLGVATLSTLIALLNAVLPAGVGLKEIAIGLMLQNWLPMPIGLLIGLAYRILQTLDEVLWVGTAYILSKLDAKRKNNPKEV